MRRGDRGEETKKQGDKDRRKGKDQEEGRGKKKTKRQKGRKGDEFTIHLHSGEKYMYCFYCN